MTNSYKLQLEKKFLECSHKIFKFPKRCLINLNPSASMPTKNTTVILFQFLFLGLNLKIYQFEIIYMIAC